MNRSQVLKHLADIIDDRPYVCDSELLANIVLKAIESMTPETIVWDPEPFVIKEEENQVVS